MMLQISELISSTLERDKIFSVSLLGFTILERISTIQEKKSEREQILMIMDGIILFFSSKRLQKVNMDGRFSILLHGLWDMKDLKETKVLGLLR